MDKKDEELTSGQFAEMANVSDQTIRRWDDEGRIKPDRRLPGKHRRYKRSKVEEFLRTLEQEL